MFQKIRNWWHRPCSACNMKQAEIKYLREMLTHHMTLEADQRKVADTFERRYDDLIKRHQKKAEKERRGIIDNLTEYLDPLPVDGTSRKNVVARIAGMFETELGAQIRHLITRMEHEVSRFPLTEREADFHRAGINFGHLLLDWGTECISEHHANLAGDKATADQFGMGTDPEEDKAVENIKSKVKE